MRRLNNKGFAITGILYTVFIVFLLIMLSVLSLLRIKKNMLEKSLEVLEGSFDGKKMDIEAIKNFNSGSSEDKGKINNTGKYIFYVNGDFEETVSCDGAEWPNCSIKSFTVPSDDYYKLEIWGAKNGEEKGGYSVGYIYLKKDDELNVSYSDSNFSIKKGDRILISSGDFLSGITNDVDNSFFGIYVAAGDNMPDYDNKVVMKGNDADKGHVKISHGGITCDAYLKKGSQISDDIVFTNKDCNDYTEWGYSFNGDVVGNVLTLVDAYSFDDVGDSNG